MGAKKGRNRIKLCLLGTLVILAALMLGASRASVSGSPHQPLPPGGDIRLALVGPRHVVVRDLPPPSVTATKQVPEAVAPRHLPPEWAGPAIAPLTPPPAANAVDPALSVQSASNSPPAVSTARFEGLDNNNNAATAGFTVTPPDSQLAVGPNHVFEMVNVVGRIYTRTGGAVQTFTLASFFAVPAGFDDTDPKIIYDALSSRWFASYVSFIDNPSSTPDEGRLHIAVSQTNDPTGAWNVYFLQYNDVLPDYAAIGLTTDKLTASSNLFLIDPPNLFVGEHTIVLEKADLLAGLPAASVGLFQFPASSRFTVRPAHSLSPVNDQYLVTRSRASSTTLTLIQITGTPDAANVTEAAATNLTITAQSSPPDSPTAGGGSIDSGDFRLLETIWRDGQLWASASAACRPAGDSTTRSCAHLIEVNTAPPPSIAQDIMFGAPAEYYSWPAVRTDASGDLYVSLTHTNTSIFAEARAAGRLAGDPPNTMTGSNLLRAGDVFHNCAPLSPPCRWGDYAGAAVDPNFPECVWLVGEYAKNTAGSDWGTYIAATSYSAACDSDNDSWTDSAEAIIGTNPALACGTNANPADFNDDGFFTAFDLSAVAADIGKLVPPASPRTDIAPDLADGQVTAFDLAVVANRIGQSCP